METFLANFHINQEMNFWALLDVRDSFKDLEKGRPNSEDNGIIKFSLVFFNSFCSQDAAHQRTRTTNLAVIKQKNVLLQLLKLFLKTSELNDLIK